jgi:hypothetical protein
MPSERQEEHVSPLTRSRRSASGPGILLAALAWYYSAAGEHQRHLGNTGCFPPTI